MTRAAAFFVFVLKGCKLQGQARGAGTHIHRRKQRGESKFRHKVDGNTCSYCIPLCVLVTLYYGD